MTLDVRINPEVNPNPTRVRWLRRYAVFVGVFGLLGWPLSLFVIADGAPAIGLGVFAAGTVLMLLAGIGWLMTWGHGEQDRASDPTEAC